MTTFPPRHEVLFPDTEYREQMEQALGALLRGVQLRSGAGSVMPNLAASRCAALPSFDAPADLGAVLETVVTQMTEGQVQTTHPGYFGLFNPAPTFPAELADRIAASFNPQICVWTHAPFAVDVENHVIREIAVRLGLPADSGGHFTSGGSEANYTAALCALTRHTPAYGDDGVFAFPGQPVIYVSRESHLAWLKIAHQLGIGRQAVRQLATDGAGRMDASALRDAIEADTTAGAVPIMVAATAGTTNAGVVDPLDACADIARQYGLWFHVDAAWGGALVVSDTLRPVLDGIQRADSVTIDAHKWFAATMGAGMFLTRDLGLLNQTFRVATDYMPSNDAGADLYVNSVQWSRRFVGLRLFLALATAGWQGFAQHVERGVALVDLLIERLAEDGWQCRNTSRMAVACLVPPAGSPAVTTIVSRVLASCSAWVSETRFEREPVLRVCVTNGYTGTEDVERLCSVLRSAIAT
ncbi:MAG: aminotransferase class V-fold PLP-dependent enzyme [Pseudomonadota bacterium]